ncbi:MAG: UDP-N-acetylmuramate dehydrogenase [Gammaproteobacteria bacterium]
MIQVVEHAELLRLNTFGVPGYARFLATVHSVAELQGLLGDPAYAGIPRRVLGGGSNIVLGSDEVNALVIHLAFDGWRVAEQAGTSVLVEVDAGMNWHALVAGCVEAGYGGIENLALIPGLAGAAPVQNIGAYGVEVASCIERVDAVRLDNGEPVSYTREQCRFSYRDSIFKHEASGVAIVSVRLRLDTSASLSLDYRDLRDELAALGDPEPSRELVFRMVCDIRRRKLPDPAVLGNAGSFFRNPVVDKMQFEELAMRFPGIVGYPQPDGRVKVAAGWLIEHAGWKGFRDGPVGVHERQALVLVNHGQARGSEVLALAQRIAGDIFRRFGVTLSIEPAVW